MRDTMRIFEYFSSTLILRVYQSISVWGQFKAVNKSAHYRPVMSTAQPAKMTTDTLSAWQEGGA
jgi:hypothetical protein